MAYSGRTNSPQYRSTSPSRQFYPDNPRYDGYPNYNRSPSPGRGPPRQNYGQNNYGRRENNSRVDPSEYGHKRTGYDDYEAGYGNGAAEALGRRRCCTAFLVCLVLLLLAGLAVGLYFAITKMNEKAAANSPQKLVNSIGYNGYYVNGVYVVPVTTKPRDTYLIYGTDTPCNRYNNVTATNPVVPNCNQVTTRIVLANWTTLRPVVLVPVYAGVSPTAPGGPLATFVGLALSGALAWYAFDVGL